MFSSPNQEASFVSVFGLQRGSDRDDNEIVSRVDKQGVTRYYLKSSGLGVLHREDGPAVLYPDGSFEWWLNGQIHRENGPAVKKSNGDEMWYLFGKLHRYEGPAVTYVTGDKRWWCHGQPVMLRFKRTVTFSQPR